MSRTQTEKYTGKPKNTGVGSLFLLQWIFPTQEFNQGLLHCRFFTNWAIREAHSLLHSSLYFCVGASFCICHCPDRSQWQGQQIQKLPWETLGRRCAGSRREASHSWQRSWGRRLGIRKGRIEPQESPWIFSSIYPPKNQSLPTSLLCALTSDFTGGCPPPPLSLCQRVNLQLQLIKFLAIRSV